METKQIKQREEKEWDIYISSYLKDFQSQEIAVKARSNKKQLSSDRVLSAVIISLYLVVPALLFVCILSFAGFLEQWALSMIRDFRVF
jgi:hypothetical protein